MQAGDLVQHRFDEYGVGVILEAQTQAKPRTSRSSNWVAQDRLVLVHFDKEAKPRYYRENYLELINASK